LRGRLEPSILAQNGDTVEFEHQSTTGRHKTLLVKAQAVSTDGSRVLLLMFEDITLRREAELLTSQQKEALEGEIEIAARKLNRSQEELRGLTAHLFTVQEEERQRVARELHDDISQRLSALEILLHEIETRDRKGVDLERIESARSLVQSLNTDVRQISHRLHPAILQDLGLPAALKAMVQEFGHRENMPATYTSEALPESWSSEAATAVYRIAQEALRNVSKHAGKTHVKVMLAGSNSHLELRVMDFGLGFDQDSEDPVHGLGMISMQERARLAGGTLAVRSFLGQGTTVTATIPLNHHE
jgi:two-component system CheB/CheR fusion protein